MSSAPASAEPTSREDAAGRVAAIARYLRRENPVNAAGYMITRALRWSELRATGNRPHPKVLVAPPSELRMGLKTLAADGNWDQVLETAEESAGQPWGRAWLDVHRYAVIALQVANREIPMKSVLSGLKALLADMPFLLEWSLADDTPVANAETMAWLKEMALLPGAEPELGLVPEPEPAPELPPAPVPVAQPDWYPPPPPPSRTSQEEGGEPAPPDAYDLAMEAARSGRVDEALNILSREVQHENCGRARFLRRTQLAQVCMATGNPNIGRPILQELADEIERRGLEQWESADVVAPPLTLLYRCLDDPQDASGEKRKLYARICRLDPSRALGLR
jgi:type VI secretion system protein ImpA